MKSNFYVVEIETRSEFQGEWHPYTQKILPTAIQAMEWARATHALFMRGYDHQDPSNVRVVINTCEVTAHEYPQY